MKSLLFAVSVLLGGMQLLAQNEFESQVDEEFNQVYQNSTPSSSSNSTLKNGANQNIKVETTQNVNISDVPLNESRADRLRRSRQQMEVETEQKIVERLESARMDDEKKRADVAQSLFQSQPQNQATTNVVTPTQTQNQSVQQIEQGKVQPIVVEIKSSKDEEKIRDEEKVLTVNEVKEEIKEIVSEFKEEKEVKKPETYFKAFVGLSEYDGVKNVQGNYSVGVGFGTEVRERVIFEGAFIFTNYEIERTDRMYYNPYNYYSYYSYPVQGVFQDLNQYNFQGALKYQFLDGTIHPSAGVALAYVYRKYDDVKYPSSFIYQNPIYGTYTDVKSSHAIDFGVVGGIDVMFSEGFSLNFDVRYMTNLYTRTYTNTATSFVMPPKANLIEERSYYQIGIGGLFNF